MKFGTVLNCIDGRVQLQVNTAIREMFDIEYLDTITEAGVVKVVAEHKEAEEYNHILHLLKISREKHDSHLIGVAAHHDCAGNPVSEEEQKEQIRVAVEFLGAQYPDCIVAGFWVDSDWKAHLISKY